MDAATTTGFPQPVKSAVDAVHHHIDCSVVETGALAGDIVIGDSGNFINNGSVAGIHIDIVIHKGFFGKNIKSVNQVKIFRDIFLIAST